MRIERKYLAHYIRVEDGKYVRLGEDLEEFTPELSANVEKHNNILGEKRVTITDFEKTAAVEPIYADEDSPLYRHLQTLIDSNAVQENLKTEVLDVRLWEEGKENTFYAVAEEAYIEITSYGGDHNGYRIGFKLHYTGVKRRGEFNALDNTFTDQSAE